MKAQQENQGLFNDVGDHTIHGQQGPAGPQGPPSPGFKKTSDGNYDAEDKKFTNLQKCVDEKDAANKYMKDMGFVLNDDTIRQFSTFLILPLSFLPLLCFIFFGHTEDVILVHGLY